MENPYLEWIDENQQTQRIEIVERVRIGRTCKGIDPEKRVLLQFPLVSRDHAELNFTVGNLQITDTSKNGTWVNDVRMAAGATKELSDGDIIRIGYSILKVAYPKITTCYAQSQTCTEFTIVSTVEEIVTILVSDLRGFSAYSKTHDSTEVCCMINEIFESFSRVIEDFNGTVKDYAGDSVIAFWEHQFKEPTRQAELACQAAIQQLKSFDQIRIKLSGKFTEVESLRMGWGITTGPVTLSHFGSRAADLAMVGDCINLAHRLSVMANKDIDENILIGLHTAELIGDQIALKDVGTHSIRGLQGKEHIYALNCDRVF